MSRRANPAVIGAFVVGAVAILVAAVLLIGSGRIFRRTLPFVSYFDGTVHGLRAGAAVKYKGVELGKVSRIRIPYWLGRSDPPIAVFLALDADKLEDVGERSTSWRDAVHGAIGQGLRAQLESDSLVTGVLHVALTFAPDSPARVHDPIQDVIEIPTIPPPLQELGAALQSMVDRVARSDIEGLLASARDAFDGVAELTRRPELASSLAALERTLGELEALAAELRARAGPLADEVSALARSLDGAGASVPPLAESLLETSARLQSLAASMEETLVSARGLLHPQSPLPVGLRAGLREVSDAARSARALFELLERDPAVLLRGKASEGAR